MPERDSFARLGEGGSKRCGGLAQLPPAHHAGSAQSCGWNIGPMPSSGFVSGKRLRTSRSRPQRRPVKFAVPRPAAAVDATHTFSPVDALTRKGAHERLLSCVAPETHTSSPGKAMTVSPLSAAESSMAPSPAAPW